MILAFECQCGESYSLYATPGAMHRCWKCRRRARVTGDEHTMQARQEFEAHLVPTMPGFLLHATF